MKRFCSYLCFGLISIFSLSSCSSDGPDGMPPGFNPDYSQAEIISCDPRVQVYLDGCKRVDDEVYLYYRIKNVGLGNCDDFRVSYNIFVSPNNDSSIAVDNDGNVYDVSWMKVNESAAHTDNWGIKSFSFPANSEVSLQARVWKVDPNAKGLSFKLVAYACPTDKYKLERQYIEIRNVPIGGVPYEIPAKEELRGDYSQAVVTTCDPRVDVRLIDCVRIGSDVKLNYTLTNTGLGNCNDFRLVGSNMQSGNGEVTYVYDDAGNSYLMNYTNELGGKSSSEQNVTNSLPPNAPVKCSMTLRNVDPAAKVLNFVIGCYAYPYSQYNLERQKIEFMNVPIDGIPTPPEPNVTVSDDWFAIDNVKCYRRGTHLTLEFDLTNTDRIILVI